MKTNPVCRDCGVELTSENWYPSQKKKNRHICKSCDYQRYKQWRRANPDKARAISTRSNRKQGMRSLNENKECAAYLGIHIAEQALSQAFKNVKRMPMNNPGYDIICNHNKKIDVKSACKGKDRNRWFFNIYRDTVADYFLMLAFDSRENLNLLYAWLIPGSKLNHLISTSISQSTIHKWDAYKLDISKINECCNTIRCQASLA